MSGGPNQHYLPRFLQKPFGICPKRKEIWVFAHGVAPEPKRIKKVGASEHFYSSPEPTGARTLDDEITHIEKRISRMLSNVRAEPLGTEIKSTIAAEIVNHLIPRTAHFRASMERGLLLLADGFETILSDENAVQSLMGLIEDEPTEDFRRNVADKLDGIEGLREIGLPDSLIERMAFILAKETFPTISTGLLPKIREVFRSWIEPSQGLVREAHNEALSQISPSTPRLSLLEEMIWTIQPAQPEGAILPDCVALAVDRSGRAWPPMLANWDDVAAIVLPLAPEKLLVGVALDYHGVHLLDFNKEAARSSHDFFLAPTTSTYFEGLQRLLRESSMKPIEEGVSGAMAPYFAKVPRQNDESPPFFLADFNDTSSQPWQCEVSLTNFGDAESRQKIANVVVGIVTSLAKALPLKQLDGITITADYRETVASLDRGYEGATPPGAVPESIGTGIARNISVKRNGRWKNRVILDASVAFALLAEEKNTVEWGLYILIIQLSEVALTTVIERQLPGVWMNPIDDPLHSFLYPSVHPALMSYFGSYFSSGFADPLHNTALKRELLIAALSKMTAEGLAARLEYRHDGDLDRFLSVVMPHISYTLQFAADLLGHCGASGAEPFDADGKLLAALTDSGLHQWFPVFS